MQRRGHQRHRRAVGMAHQRQRFAGAREQVAGRGYDVYGFREVDVGDNITYSIDLTADE